MVNEATDTVTRQAHEEAIVDTGATMHISGIRNDFIKIEDQPTVRIRTAGGQVKEGQNAVFKPNNLGVIHGTYLPELGQQRLTSGHLLCKDGWKLTVDREKGSFLRHPETNSIYTLNYGESLLKVPFGTSTENGSQNEK